MASTGVNVLRWGALVFGVFYGLSHQTQISSQAKIAAAQHDWDRKASLIEEARAEFKKQTSGPEQGSSVISDPNNPKFDLEAYLKSVPA
ncbi:hypothetical protein LTR08_004570 [Meristemomyces frigidus]|nr:hypothetical protein LTR08_004570 [Meristemomyces frigidus]